MHHHPVSSCVCLHFQPSRLTSFLSTHNQSSLGFLSPFHLCHVIQCPLFVFTAASSHLFLVDTVSQSEVDHIYSPTDLSNLSAPVDTGVLRSPKAEAPHAPVSSSAPPTRKNITLSHPQVPQRSSQPFSTSKTFTDSTTTKGNGVDISA